MWAIRAPSSCGRASVPPSPPLSFFPLSKMKLGARCDDGLDQWRVCYDISLVHNFGEGEDDGEVATCLFMLEMYDTL